MKRSRHLVFTTVMATAGVSLAACDTAGPGVLPGPAQGDQVEAWSYPDLDACLAGNEIPDDACREGARTAEADQAAAAPKFADAQSCEEKYGEGQCVPKSQASGGGSIWGPLITGFVVGRMLDGGWRGQGMYRDRYGGMATGWGGGLNTDYATGRTRISANSLDPPAAIRAAPPKLQTRTSVVSRGGFGGRMSERSYSSSRWGG